MQTRENSLIIGSADEDKFDIKHTLSYSHSSDGRVFSPGFVSIIASSLSFFMEVERYNWTKMIEWYLREKGRMLITERNSA